MKLTRGSNASVGPHDLATLHDLTAGLARDHSVVLISTGVMEDHRRPGRAGEMAISKLTHGRDNRCE
jgi:hypothetical protein